MVRTPVDVPAIVASIKDGSSPTAMRSRSAVQLARTGRRQPTVTEVADALGVDQQRIESFLKSQVQPVRPPIPVPDPAIQASYQESLILRRAASAIQALPLAPPTVVTLDKPIVIWETQPHIESNVFIDAEYTPGDAGLRFMVDDAQDSHSRTFIFYYLWQNPSEFYAVVNVSTSLLFTGVCTATSNTGFFSGDLSTISMGCSLGLIRNGGWGVDPISNTPANGTPYPGYQQTLNAPITSLSAQGGGLFGDPGFAQQEFALTPFDLSFVNMVIPGGASTLFEVTVSESDSVSSFEISNSAELDFATGGNRVACPGVELQILTPVGQGVTGFTASGQLITEALA